MNLGISRKSVHGKQKVQQPVAGAAKTGPPSAFAKLAIGDRVPLVKKDLPRQSSSRFRAAKKVELIKLQFLVNNNKEH